MSHYTKGPWHIANGCQIRGSKDQIAKAWMMRNGEGLANASLISAAPELLEALEGLLAIVEQHDTPLSDPERISARVAIAKARGN